MFRLTFAAALMTAAMAQETLSGCSLVAANWEKGCSAEEIDETLKWVVEGTFTDSETCTAWSTEAQTSWGCPEGPLDIAAMRTATIEVMPTGANLPEETWETTFT